MNRRFAAAALTLGLALCAALPAIAQNRQSVEPGQGGSASDSRDVVVEIPGPCMVAVNNQPVKCAGVAYTASPDSGRIMFTAVGVQADMSFSGAQDDNEDGRYTLMLDSVLSRQTGLLQARGECRMQMAEDGMTVHSIECLARTKAGAILLKAAGVAKTGADANGDDEDDDNDDGDDGPDAVQA
jgi:hypothetical protein